MFITLEGPEGSGKSSQLPALAEFLRSRGYTVLTTREPGGTPIGDQVRQVLTRMENQGMSPRAETLLFCAARAQLVDQVIRPALARGEVVISDRYADSTLAYQGYGHGNDLAVLRQMLHFATGGLWPELTLLLDVDSAAGLERRRSSGGEWNRLDDYALSFHQRVRQGYLDLARSQPERWVVVDASQPMDAVQQALRQVILRRLEPALS
ncbi:dTMP kinase [Levilinea saccharolytica]|uniref:Thymidylate kinase n=1 Tax=Levilinea saccharolytica TaxID=229921 RepID=A0A0P6XKE3_9CHLR|nr:dTMP kinase [Levilinea saccharolytica]KPL80507.1 thymidylate kinase [Levilinea saccharolytica]GAP16222.1 thymidylate kinase [Levilinea saccharolytica]